jgi:hypothetical protein
MNTPTFLGATAALLLALAPQSSAAALTQSGATGIGQIPSASPLDGAAAVAGDSENVDGGNVDGGNVDGGNVDGGNVDGGNVGGGNVGGGNVTVGVPGASIAADDEVDQSLQSGHAYRGAFAVWVAPNAGRATMVLKAHGANLSSCSSMRLRPGTTSAVMCLVRGNTNGNRISIDAVVQTANLGTFTRTFSHALTR